MCFRSPTTLLGNALSVTQDVSGIVPRASSFLTLSSQHYYNKGSIMIAIS